MLHIILFLAFGGLCLGGAVNVLAQKTPIGSALSLIVVMGSLAVLYLLLGAEFVAAVQLIIYTGAIMVLFVFIIMLVDTSDVESSRTSRAARWIGLPAMLIGAAAGAVITWTSFPEAAMLSIGELHGDARNLGALLFGEYLLPFEFTSALVLIAIMGAVVLSKRGE